MKPTSLSLSLILPLAILLAILLALLVIWALLSRAKARQRQRQRQKRQRVRRAPRPSSMEAGQRDDKGGGVAGVVVGGRGGGVDHVEAVGVAEWGFGGESERVWARGDRRVTGGC